MRYFRVGHGSDVGRVRRANEDAYLALTSTMCWEAEAFPFGLFMVADGMGGHRGGAQASRLAVQRALKSLIGGLYLPLWSGKSLDPPQIPIVELLTDSVLEANAAVYETVTGGGTTLSIAAIIGDSVYVAHVGDSRVYLLRDGSLEQVSRDHSLAARMVELEGSPTDRILAHPQRSFLYRAVGRGKDLEVDFHIKALAEESHLLMCSDGLWSLVSEEEMANVVRSYPDPQQACERLIEAANQKGGDDNITAILVDLRRA